MSKSELPPLETGSQMNARGLDSNASSNLSASQSPFNAREPEILPQASGDQRGALQQSEAAREGKLSPGAKVEGNTAENLRPSSSGSRPRSAGSAKSRPEQVKPYRFFPAI